MNRRYNKFSIELLNMNDQILDVWMKSRPHLDNSNFDAKKIKMMNLPVNGFNTITLFIESSILLRDLLFSFRPIEAWAMSNRTFKYNHDNLFLSDEVEFFGIDSSDLHKKLDEVIKCVINGEKQDYAKQRLPMMTSTRYCVQFSFRTLLSVLYTFKLHIPKYFELFRDHGIFDMIKISEEDFDLMNKVDLYYKVSISDEEKSMCGKSSKMGDMFFVSEEVTCNLMAQFIRQHSSHIKNELWNKVSSDFENSLNMICNSNVQVVGYIDKYSMKNLTSTRTCWFAQMDKESNASWSVILGDLVEKMNPDEFIEQLPCHGDCNNCKIKGDMIPRVTRDEVNPPCPILIENPFIINERIKNYDSNSRIINKWKECIELIDVNPDNEYNKIYYSTSEKTWIDQEGE